MVLCQDCKFWGAVDEWRRAPRSSEGRGCGSPKLLTGYHENEIPEDGILVEDDEGWAMITGPKFGCVHGETNEVKG